MNPRTTSCLLAIVVLVFGGFVLISEQGATRGKRAFASGLPGDSKPVAKNKSQTEGSDRATRQVTGPRATIHSAIAQGATATITLQPVPPKTQPPSSYPAGSTIVGQELTLGALPVRVWLELLATGWAPQSLKTIQAKIGSSGYLGANADCAGAPGTGGDLRPAYQTCAVNTDCRLNMSGLAGPCGTGEPSRCMAAANIPSYFPPGVQACEPGFQDKCDPEWILSGVAGIPAVDISTLNYRYGATSEPPDVMSDFSPSYLGTLVLDVPASAKGAYTIGYIVADTFMLDSTQPIAQEIPIAALNPGKITIPCGKCCFGQPDVQCAGGVTAAECASLSPPTAFTPGGVCTGDIVVDCGLQPTVVEPGEDLWRTECGLTMVDFCLNPIPADFFDPGSLPFDGLILLGGESGGADTRMARTDEMVFAAELPAVAQTPIVLSYLDLVSCDPITVEFCGSPAQLWDVEAELSEVGQQAGMMTATKTHANGGTFTADFHVTPKFTFTKVGEPTTVRVLDTGDLGQPPTHLGTTDGAWVHQLTLTGNPPPSNFLPGIKEEQNRGGTQCCVLTLHDRLVASTEEVCTQHAVHAGFDVDCSACLKGACCNPANGGCTLAEPAGAQSAQEVCESGGGTFKGGGTTCDDGDGDGLADVMEMSPECCTLEAPVDLCSLPTKADDSDTDGDGCLDGDEVVRGSDPCNVCDPLIPPLTCGPPDEDANGNGIPDVCEPRGACCDPCDQTCTDDTPQPKCREPGKWFEDTPCVDLSASCSPNCAAPLQIVLQPGPADGKDSYIHGGGGTSQNWNEGATQVMVVGVFGPDEPLRGLIEFDLTAIPSEAMVQSATLSLYVTFAQANDLALHRITVPWLEGVDVHDFTAPGATWDTSDGVTSWGCGGVFPCATELNQIGVAAITANQWNDFALDAARVQEWTSGAVANHGMLVKHPTELPGQIIDIYSSDYTDDSTLWPKLTLELLIPQPCPQTPVADPSGIDKPRFVSFSVPSAPTNRIGASKDSLALGLNPTPLLDSRGTDAGATAGGSETALRINLDSLHHVNPPYTGAPSVAFTACEGKDRWVGPPSVFIESQSNPIRFVASQTQSTPFYRDWSSMMSCSDNVAPFEYGVDFSPVAPLPVCATDGDCPSGETCLVAVDPLVHVTGSSVVSSSSYTVENVAFSCLGSEATCTAVSAGLTVETARWGDVVATFQLLCGPSHPNPLCQDAGTCTGTNCTTQADASDFGSLVSKFRSQLGAPIKARGLLAGGGAAGIIDIIPDLGFQHISSGVAAFQGKAYPYTPECMTNP